VQARPTVAGPVLGHALGFVLGFSAVFVLFGVSLGLLGFFLRQHLDMVQKVAGSLLILLGLHLAGVIPMPWLEQERRPSLARGTGYARSFLVGASFATGWSPCIGPTLGAILALAVSGGTVPQAAALLLAYSAGMALPFLAMGAAFNALGPIYRWLRRWAWAVNYVSGVVLVVVGVLVFTDSLVGLNRLFDWGPLSRLSGRL
jgi:cytochrome c-type biogenesis protein